uniref:Glucuronosyltransferase n=1 Tax=Panagrolaimus superbus TaxID=310955 RepID=A0A914Y0M9_9BILA
MSFSGKIADTLAGAGHEVVIYQPILNENATFTGSKHTSIRYYTMPKNYSLAPDFSMDSATDKIWEMDSIGEMKKLMTKMSVIRADFRSFK